jgi:hypothetical protein
MLDVNAGDVRTVGPPAGFIMQAPDYWSGGWANRGFSFTNSSNTILAQFGAYGSGAPSTLGYAYVGTSYSSPWMTFLPGGNVGVGTTSPAHLLQVAGTIGAKEVIVSSTGADYVFAPEYRLAPLREVAAYVEAHHHLPEIPSAAEVQEKGISLGEMQAKLLAKIEELTLHMIAADEKISKLQEQNLELQKRVAEKVGK